MKLAGTFVCSVVAVLALAGPAHAGFGPIAVGDDFFNPSSIEEDIGNGQFRWVWEDDVQAEHNVVHDNKLFKSGQPTDDPAAEYGPIELPAGGYDYFCEIHSGMDGNIKIKPRADVEGPDFTRVTWAFDRPERVGDRWQVQYRRGTGQWKTWKRNAAVLDARFGAGDKPVNFNPDREYQVRVKTRLASKPERQSKFSPPITFGGIMR